MKITRSTICAETKPKHTAMSGDDYCCYCNAFGMRFIIQRPDPNCYTCGSKRGKASTFPVPALTQVTVRRIGYAFFCLGILATLGLFAAMAVSQQLRYPGPNWCGTWEMYCQNAVMKSGGIGVMNSFDKAYVAIMLGTLIFNILGLIGVGREKRSILRVVGVLLVLFFVAQVTLSGIHGKMLEYPSDGITYPHEALYRGQVSMYESLKRISPNHYTWDNMQRDKTCCGVLNYEDWQKYHDYIPKSCDCNRHRDRYYSNVEISCATVNLKGNVTKSVYSRGCLGRLFQNGHWRYADRQHALWKAGLGLAFAQWFPMFFALVLGFRKKSGEVAYKGVAPPVYEQSFDDCKAIVVNEQPSATQERDDEPNDGPAD